MQGWTDERVAEQVSSAGDRVIYVLPGDPPGHLNKVQETVKVMEQEMGLAPGWLWHKQRCKVGDTPGHGCFQRFSLYVSVFHSVTSHSPIFSNPTISNFHYLEQVYLYISASKKIVGCVVAERIECAFPIVPHEHDDSKALATQCRTSSKLDSPQVKDKPKSSTQLLWGGWKFTREVVNRKKNDNQQELGRSILCSKTEIPAVCGVRGIWVSRSERRKGVASYLLDAMRYVDLSWSITLQNPLSSWPFCRFSCPNTNLCLFMCRRTFCVGLTLEASQCAFSQPSPDGEAFAARYCGTPSFLVYQSPLPT